MLNSKKNLLYVCTCLFLLVIVAIPTLIGLNISQNNKNFRNYVSTTGKLTSKKTIAYKAGERFTSYTPTDKFSEKYEHYDVVMFGATGNGSTDDTKAINKALFAAHQAGGGTVIIPNGDSGNYLISAPLVIYSNTSLIVDPQTTITLSTSSDCNMLIDASHYSGDLTVPSTMHNISVQGGIWARGHNFGLKNNVHSIILGGNNLLIKGATFTSSGGKYAVLIQNASHFTVRDLFMNNTWSDGVHIQGPAKFGFIQNIKGKAGDDMISLTPYDWISYTWGNEGDITDIDIDTIELNGQSIANGVKVLGGSIGNKALKSDRINISNVSGNTVRPFMSAIYLGDDIAELNTMNGKVDNITIKNVDFNLPDGSTNSLINIVGSSTSLEIPTISIDNVNFSSDMSALISNTGKVAHIALSNVLGNTKTKPTNIILQNNSVNWAYINHLQISDLNIAFAKPGGNLIFSPEPKQGLGNVLLNNIYLYNVANIANIGTITNFQLSNIYLQANHRLLYLNTNAAATIDSSVNILASSTYSIVPNGSNLYLKTKDFPSSTQQRDFGIYADKIKHLIMIIFQNIKNFYP